MPDAIGNKTAHDYHLDVPAPEQGFFAAWATGTGEPRIGSPTCSIPRAATR
ncbi:hypothetical protein [Oscillibacter sp.]|uniref:hypothetical protein n=1 Tax=Oscillibacter sp. TaxID=1945593 RepID=UPI00338EBB81